MQLDVRELAVGRGGVTLLTGLTFHLGRGEVMILRGPNGVGKTSLLRTIAGLQPKAAGEIRLADDSVVYAGHSDAVKATLTVRENLEFWAAINGTTDVDGALLAMALADLADRPARSLSAGQRRRLGLARLATASPFLWLLDEPTVSLDRESVVLFAAMVTRHRESGGAALIASHIDLGIGAVTTLDLGLYRARAATLADDHGAFDQAFL